MYTFGGERPGGVFPNHEAYDARTNTWATLAPLPTPRHGLGAVVLGGRIYTIAGGPAAGSAQTDVVEVYAP
jgi:hypothetical protein